MRIRHTIFAAALVVLAGPGTPRPCVGQVSTDTVEDQYLAAVASQFGVPDRELDILSEAASSLDELPVLLRIAHGTGIAPTAILAQRRGGATWVAVASRYGVGASLFYVNIPPGEGGTLLGRALRAFEEAAPGERDSVSLTDDEVVALENVRILSGALGMPAGQVLRAREQSPSFVQTYGALRGGR